MSFFYSQDTLNVFQWILRGAFGYLFLIIVSKFMGQRSISQLRFIDFVVALVLGNIIAHPLSDENLSMLGSLITTSVLVILYIIITFLSLKLEYLRRFFEPPPLTIMKNGNIIYKNLVKAKISIDFLLAELRKNKVDNLQKVAVALWEPGGTISVFLESQYKEVTLNDIDIIGKPYSLPVPIIKEGKIDRKALREMGKDENWLTEQITTDYNNPIERILLATLDDNNNLHVFLK